MQWTEPADKTEKKGTFRIFYSVASGTESRSESPAALDVGDVSGIFWMSPFVLLSMANQRPDKPALQRTGRAERSL
jgi:hypothetical protein